MQPLLELKEVTKSFGGVAAVKNLSFSLGQGEIMGLIGPNGAGKTTVFNIVTGVYQPESGGVYYDGQEITGKRAHGIARMGITRTFQTIRPLSKMTVAENAMMGALFGRHRTLSLATAKERSLDALNYTGLGGKANVPAGELTIAEQRRLELARALAAQPRLLLLDEVMAGLNPSEAAATLELLNHLSKERGITLLVIEHIMRTVMKLCETIVVMNEGTVIAKGTPAEIVKNAEVIKAYMGEHDSNLMKNSGASPTG